MTKKVRTIITFVLIVLTIIAGSVSFYLAQQINNANLDTRTAAETPNSTKVTIDSSIKINNFNSKMRGIDLAPWEHSWGRPFLANVQGIKPVLEGIKPGLVRYSGGLWINNGSFVEGLNQQRPNEDASIETIEKAVKAKYPTDTNEYGWNYGVDEVDSLGKLANEMGFEVMVQVNVVNNNPQMWADMVKYTKSKNYPFNYWEFGNEIDLTNWQNQTKITPDEYAKRVSAYSTAMKNANPDIKLIGGVPAYPVPPDWINQGDDGRSISSFIKKSYGNGVDAVSYHWYQIYNDKKQDTLDSVTKFQFIENNQPIDTKVWNNSYSRIWGDILPPRIQSEGINNDPKIEIGVSELNVDSYSDGSFVNQNHIGAVWQADQIGRLAYSGSDFATIWLGYSDSPFGMITHKDGSNLQIKSSYYASYMYKNYFGDTLVSSTVSDKNNVSVWASIDSKDTNKLKLMIVNYSTSENPINLSFPKFQANTASIYKLTSTQAITSSTNINQENLESRLNGVQLTPSNIGNPGISPVTSNVNSTSMDYTAPAFSVSSIILDGNATATLTTTASQTPELTQTTTTTPAATTPASTVTITAPATTIITAPTTSNTNTPAATQTSTPMITTTSTLQATVTSTTSASNSPTQTSIVTTQSNSSVSQTPDPGLPNTGIEKYSTGIILFIGVFFAVLGAGYISFSRSKSRL